MQAWRWENKLEANDFISDVDTIKYHYMFDQKPHTDHLFWENWDYYIWNMITQKKTDKCGLNWYILFLYSSQVSTKMCRKYKNAPFKSRITHINTHNLYQYVDSYKKMW